MLYTHRLQFNLFRAPFEYKDRFSHVEDETVLSLELETL